MVNFLHMFVFFCVVKHSGERGYGHAVTGAASSHSLVYSAV